MHALQKANFLGEESKDKVLAKVVKNIKKGDHSGFWEASDVTVTDLELNTSFSLPNPLHL